MKNPPNAFAKGSVFIAVKIEQIAPAISADRRITRQSNMDLSSAIRKPLNGSRTKLAMINRDQATKNCEWPAWLNSLLATSPVTTKEVDINMIKKVEKMLRFILGRA